MLLLNWLARLLLRVFKTGRPKLVLLGRTYCDPLKEITSLPGRFSTRMETTTNVVLLAFFAYNSNNTSLPALALVLRHRRWSPFRPAFNFIERTPRGIIHFFHTRKEILPVDDAILLVTEPLLGGNPAGTQWTSSFIFQAWRAIFTISRYTTESTEHGNVHLLVHQRAVLLKSSKIVNGSSSFHLSCLV